MPLFKRECLHCGLSVAAAPLEDLDQLPASLICPKCDDDMMAQHDSTCLTRDIAHQRESVAKALEKLDAALLKAWQGYYCSLRLIVGGGLIRTEVLGQLHFLQQRGLLQHYAEERPNRGAILVTVRQVTGKSL